MMIEVKMIDAYQIGNKILVQGFAKTDVGLYILDGSVLALENPVDSIQLGQCILEIAGESGKIIPHPTREERKERNKNDLLLKEAKVKTWNAMMKAARNVIIRLNSKEITMTPTRFLGTRGDSKGYYELESKVVTCPVDQKQIGHALLEAFDLCE